VIKLGKIIKKEADITPDTNVTNSWRSTGRELYESLSDLIDNSIDSTFSEETYERLYEKNVINVDWYTIPKSAEWPELAGKKGWKITDAGSGIRKPRSCWKAGASKKKKSIGRFGIGLKHSSLELGNIILIKTKREGDDYFTTLPFDFYKFREDGKWKLRYEEEDGASKKEHYTEVLITDCNDPEPDLENIYEYLSRTYYKMCDDRLKILFNGRELKWDEPEVFEISEEKEIREKYHVKVKRAKIFAECDEVIYGNKNREYCIKGWAGIQKKHEQKYDGIDVFLNGRLIESSSRIGVGPNKGRVYGQVFVEQDFPVNNQKTKLDRSTKEFKALDSLLSKRFGAVTEFAKRILFDGEYRPAKSVENKTRNFENELIKAMNRAFANLDDLMSNSELNKEGTPDDHLDVGEIDKLIREKKNRATKEVMIKSIAREKRKRKSKEHLRLPFLNQSMKIRHKPEEMGREKPYSDFWKRQNTLVIFSNVDHPYYSEASKLGNKHLVELHQRHLIDECSDYFSQILLDSSSKEIKNQIYGQLARLKPGKYIQGR
tara:strand:- start:152 stop:1789 length:1638 start_codon:yes stop_codon:yes gene_type:complete